VEKRFVVFIVLTMLVLTGHVFLQSMFAPLRPVQPAAAPAPPGSEASGDESEDEQAGRETAAGPGTSEEESPGEEVSEPARVAESDPQSIEVPPSEVQPSEVRRLALGSYTGSASPLLVTLNSRGGALERVELVERLANGQLRYRDLEDKSGYLGHLGLVEMLGRGARVTVVHRDTPAALAVSRESATSHGLLVGDVITGIAKPDSDIIEVLRPDAVRETLAETRPGDLVQIQVDRTIGDSSVTVVFQAMLDVRPFQVIRPEPLVADEAIPHPLSCLFSLTNVDGKSEWLAGLTGTSSAREGIWKAELIDGSQPGVEFRFELPPELNGLELVKRFRLGQLLNVDDETQAAPYHLELELAVRNSGEQERLVEYQLDGPNGLPLEGWWYSYKTHPTMFKSAGARDILFRTMGVHDQQLIGTSAIYKAAKKRHENPETTLFAAAENEEIDRTVLYMAVDTQYFVSALIPDGVDGVVFERAEAVSVGQLRARKLIRTTNVSFRLDSPQIAIPAGGEYTQKFKLYAGPKDPTALQPYGLQDTIYYGWFGGVARPLSSVLHFFYRILGNFGLAIVLLTVCVRGCMFPISRKAAKNAAMMQELAPEMKAITEKYKSDMEKRAKAQQELFRRNSYNPLGGCWLMFLQLPIFIGLYRCLSVDIELRQAALVPGFNWCSNLAGPDQLFYWGDFSMMGLNANTGLLGPYFNILPLFTIVLFLAHQKLFTPPATDEQTRIQLKMMKFMTLFIGIMFFKVASGLCLYFIASSLWGIAERKLLPKKKPTDPKEPPKPEAKPKSKPAVGGRTNSNGKGGGKGGKRAKRR
jgi:YidC/Oxa1 family membrane protein insertase